MSLAPTPTIYFNGIDYNPLFYQKASGISLTYASQNYLSRIGPNPTSVATKSTFSGNLSITNSASSTDYTNGSLIVSGGVGVAGNINLAGNIQTRKIYVNGETEADVDFGAIRCNGGMYIKKNIIMGTSSLSSKLLNYGYSISASYPYGPNFLNGSISTYNGSICSSGNVNAGENIACVNNSYCYGNSYVYGTTPSTSAITGALVIRNGGLGCMGNVFFNANLTVGEKSTLVNVAVMSLINSTDYTTGGLVISGGVGIAQDVFTNGNITSSGVLRITNTTTGIGTSALIIDGGTSIAKSLYVGNTISREKILIQSSINESSDVYPSLPIYGSGAITLQGTAGIGCGGNINVGNNICVARDVFIQGNLYNYKESLINDGGVNNNFAISGVLAVDSIVLGNKLTAPNIICNSLKSWGEVDSLNKIGCFIQLPVFPYSLPVSSSVQDITVCYTNLDLTLILSTSCAVVLQPYYKISFIGPHGYVMTTIDNTLGTTPLYSLLPNPAIYFVDYSVCKSIFLYYNNILK
jgi:hypothetical protein